MKNWTIELNAREAASRADSGQPVTPARDARALEDDARKFEGLIGKSGTEVAVPDPGLKHAGKASAGSPPHPRGADDLSTARRMQGLFSKSGNAGDLPDEAGAGVMAPPEWRAAGPGVAAVVSEPGPAAGPDTISRADFSELAARLAARIVVEGPTSTQPVVSIQLSEAVLPDTVVRVARTDSGLEVALTTCHAEAHNVLLEAAAGLGERLAAMGGGLPVQIRVLMQGDVTAEFSFEGSPDQQRRKTDGRQRKADHGQT